MKKHVKQILAMLLAVMMVLALASCTKTPASSAAPTPASSGTEPASSAAGPQKEEDIVIHAINCFYTFSGDLSKSFITNYIRETFGITIEWETYQSGEEFKPKFALQLTDNSMADLYFHMNLTVAEQNKYGQDGYLANFKEYFNVMPNFVKYFEEHPSWAAYITDEDGAVYGFPRAFAFDSSRSMVNAWVKKTWVEAAGLKSIPTTPEGIYDMLVYFRDHDMDGDGDKNNEIPFTMMTSGAGVRIDWNLRAMFGIYDVDDNYNRMVDKDGKVILANTTDNYRAYLTWMNKLYNENLLDKEFSTQAEDQMDTKTRNGIVGLFSHWGGIASATGDSTDGKNLEYLTWNGGSSEYQDKPVYVKYPGQSVVTKYHIAESSKYKERIFKMIDYFFTKEGWEIGTYGLAGTHFKYREPDAYGYKARNYDGMWEDKYKTWSEWFYSEVSLDIFNMTQWSETAEIVDNADYDTLKKMMVDAPNYTYSTRAQVRAQMIDDGVTYVDSFPFLSYTADETKERATLATDITNFLKTAKVEFINGTRPLTDDEWAKFAKQLDDMGVDRLLKIEQAAYDRYVKASK